MFLVWMLIAASGFCQNTYPSKSIIANDTVCILNIDQVRQINLAYLMRDEYRELSANYMTSFHICELKTDEQEYLIQTLEQKYAASEGIIKHKDIIIVDSDKIIKRLKFQRGFLCALLFATTTYFAVK